MLTSRRSRAKARCSNSGQLCGAARRHQSGASPTRMSRSVFSNFRCVRTPITAITTKEITPPLTEAIVTHMSHSCNMLYVLSAVQND